LLIAPGFLLIGGGLLLMRGLDTGSTWTHLLPGMIVAGIGAGLVNVPLAATAIGIVEPARAGMASGINTTFRQVGTATGVAALGSIFAGHVRSTVAGQLSGPLGAHAGGAAHAISVGGIDGVLAGVPAKLRPAVIHASQAGFVDGLNLILLIGACTAFAAAVTTFLLVRERDFVESSETEASDAPESHASAAVA
jgi:hypothetical protein